MPGADAGSEQAVGAGFRVRRQPADRFGQVGAPDDESFGRAVEQCVRATPINRTTNRANPLNREREIVERRGASPVESSIESPAMPVAAARATLSATPSGAIPKPPSKSALIGTSTLWPIARRCATASST